MSSSSTGFSRSVLCWRFSADSWSLTNRFSGRYSSWQLDKSATVGSLSVACTHPVTAVFGRFLHFFHVCRVTFYVHGGGVAAYCAVSAPMAYLWNYLLAFLLQLYKPIDWYTTTKKQQYFTRGAKSTKMSIALITIHCSAFSTPPACTKIINRTIKGRVMKNRNRHTIVTAASQYHTVAYCAVILHCITKIRPGLCCVHSQHFLPSTDRNW